MSCNVFLLVPINERTVNLYKYLYISYIHVLCEKKEFSFTTYALHFCREKFTFKLFMSHLLFICVSCNSFSVLSFLQGRSSNKFSRGKLYRHAPAFFAGTRTESGETSNYISSRYSNVDVTHEKTHETRAKPRLSEERNNRRATVCINSNHSLHHKAAREYSSTLGLD